MKRKDDEMERGWEGIASRLLCEFFGYFDTAGGPTLSSKLSQYPMNAPRIFSSDNYLMKITLKKELHAPPDYRGPLFIDPPSSLSLSNASH